ncbi:hypothetical protein FM120_23340 [Sphingobacterium faecium PCAi_F2.5]|nr:hypothetical protein FM120_23340 [Sphingobacterium faecium PCAi_F2.5]
MVVCYTFQISYICIFVYSRTVFDQDLHQISGYFAGQHLRSATGIEFHGYRHDFGITDEKRQSKEHKDRQYNKGDPSFEQPGRWFGNNLLQVFRMDIFIHECFLCHNP